MTATLIELTDDMISKHRPKTAMNDAVDLKHATARAVASRVAALDWAAIAAALDQHGCRHHRGAADA